MQFLPNSRKTKLLTAMALVVLSTNACMDKLPDAIHKGENYANAQFYGHESNKYQDIENSYTSAQYYCCGPNKPNNDVKALELYCRAAQSGHRASMIEIGRIYSHEVSAGPQSPIPFDRALAYAYFAKAGEGGYDYGDVMKRTLDESLTADEKAKATQYIADFPNIPCAITR